MRRDGLHLWSTIRGRLVGLLTIALFPAILFSGYLAWRSADAERRVIEARRFDQVNNLSLIIDGEIKSILALLQALTTSPELVAGDLVAFRRHADGAITGRVSILALLDATGQQLMSTALPVGAALPKREDMSIFTEVFAGKLIVSDVIDGTVAHRPVVSVAAPVVREGRVVSVLSAVVYSEVLSDAFSQAGINPKWAAAVVDRNGRFVTRNLDPERFIGQLARPELQRVARGASDAGQFENTTYEGMRTGNSFRRSGLTGWTSVVSVPQQSLLAPIHQAQRLMLTGALAVTLISLLLATAFAERIARSIRSFSDAAVALVAGQPLPETPIYISELADVREAYEHAERVAHERAAIDGRVRFLLDELAHRSKNLLGIIQAIARRTARTSTSLQQFEERFSQRIAGIAASQALLTTEGGDGAPLVQLIDDQLAPFVDKGSARVEVSCPDIVLAASVTQSIGLALHELATNAVKYGALMGAAGTVRITAAVEGAAGDEHLRLTWSEMGGPPVVAPARSGFGQVVIDQMVAQAVEGVAELAYRPEGFRWTLSIARKFFVDRAAESTALLRAAHASETAASNFDGLHSPAT